jgi:hypothetical protein
VSSNIPEEFENVVTTEENAQISYGLKIKLNLGESWGSSNAIILQGSTPTSGEANDSQFMVGYVTGMSIWRDWQWDSSLRYNLTSAEADHFQTWAPSTVVKIPCGEKWKAHLEYFGIFSDGRNEETVQHFLSPGVHYLLTPDCELGIRIGWGLNEFAPNFFANIGGGYRF